MDRIAPGIALALLAACGAPNEPPSLRDRSAWALIESARVRELARGATAATADSRGAIASPSVAGVLRRFDLSDRDRRRLEERAEREGWRSSEICRPPPGGEALWQHAAVLAPEPLAPLAPEFPAAACRAGSAGVAILDLVIDPRGQVLEASARVGLPDGLTEAALAAARASRWHPALLCGRPVAVHYSLPVEFRLPPACRPTAP